MNSHHSFVCSALLVAAIGALAASPQQSSRSGQQPPPAFKSGVTAVPIDVRVLDRNGQPIMDLKQEDFRILEDGVPQAIAHFRTQALAADAPTPALRARPAVQPFDGTPQNQRVFLIILGTRALGNPLAQPERLNSLIHFVRTSLLPQDQVALLAFNRATDFTSDHEKVARLLETFRASEAGARAALGRQGRPAAADTGSVFAAPAALDVSPAVKSELGFEEYVKAGAGQAMGEWDALQYGIKYLRFMGGEKHLIFVTETGPDPTWDQVKYLTSAASDARVALDTIQLGKRVTDMDIPANAIIRNDGAGEASAKANPLYDRRLASATVPEGPNTGHINPSAAERPPIQADTLAAARDAVKGPGPSFSDGGGSNPLVGKGMIYDLRYVAQQTGGQSSILDDASQTLGRIDSATRAQYLMAYYPSNGDWNGRYRTVKVEVNRPGATVLYRHGYFARRETETFDRRRVVTSNRIESAGYQLNDIRDIDVTVTASFTKAATGRGGEVVVPISIDTSRLAWGSDAEERHTAHLAVAVYCGTGDGGETIVGQTLRELNLALSHDTFDRVAKERFIREITVTVTRKPQFVKAIVYDYDADRIGSIVAKLK